LEAAALRKVSLLKFKAENAECNNEDKTVLVAVAVLFVKLSSSSLGGNQGFVVLESEAFGVKIGRILSTTQKTVGPFVAIFSFKTILEPFFKLSL
jgi:hypothetical protein